MSKFELRALIMGVDKLSPVLGKAQKNVAGFRKKLVSSGLGKPISIQGILAGGALAAPFIAATKAAISFESTMADVKKVIDFDTPEQFKQMGKDVLDMSKRMPMAAEGIGAIVAAGGQAGIAREELLQFAEDAVKMGVAFDQTADEAGQTMAVWRNAFKLNQEEVVALSDKINYLGNTGAASAGRISKIVTAIGPLAEVAGVSSGELAALGATLAGVGVNESVAGTGMLAVFKSLTAGSAATKAQQNVYKALRLDPKQIAKGMQDDAQGTILHVMKAISKVDKDKQNAVMSQLFGETGSNAVGPMLTSLDTLTKNFEAVGDAAKYTGSMQNEYAARSETTANAIVLLKNQMAVLGITVGEVLLPHFNSALGVLIPIIDRVSELAGANPWLIKGLLGAAGAFVAVRLAVYGAVVATRVLSTVMSISPVGLIVRGIALAAGFLIANWSTVGPWFAKLWAKIKTVFAEFWDWLKNVFFHFTPLGLVIKNWESIKDFFSNLWSSVLGIIRSFFGFAEVQLGFSPLDTLKKVWEPVVGFFKGVWERASKFIQPLRDAASSVGGWMSDGWDWLTGNDNPAPVLAPAPVPASAAGANSFSGELNVKFENAPPGMRAEPIKTDNPRIKSNQNVGYRSLAMGG